ncbi:polysaccharide biosynthesis C-terminal domain-containing protein [Alphaproteobacteria bacterium]|nr:polysaccharide biosynthesis C-terminal domain-containing protein [Alphaproteobacteria bacterium]
MNDKNQIAGVVKIAFTRGAGLPLSFLANFLIASSLGVLAYGQYSILIVITQSLLIVPQDAFHRMLTLHISSGLSYELAMKELGKWLAGFLALASAALHLIFFAYDQHAGSSFIAVWIMVTVYLFTFSILFFLLGMVSGKKGNFLDAGISSIVRPLAMIFFLFSFLIIKGSNDIAIKDILIAQVASGLFCIICAIIFLVKYWNKRVVPQDTKKIRVTARSLTFLTIIAGISFLLTAVDVVMLGFLGKGDQVGPYRFASSIMSLSMIVYASGQSYLASRIHSLTYSGELGESQRRIRYLVLVGTGILLLLIVCFYSKIITIILGSEFLISELILITLGLGNLMQVLFASKQINAIHYGLEEKLGYSMLSILIFNVMMNALLIPTFGIMGAAISTSLSVTIHAVSVHLVVKKYLRNNPKMSGK